MQSLMLSQLQTHWTFTFDLGNETELVCLERACTSCWAKMTSSKMQVPTYRNLQTEREEDFSTFVAGLVNGE